MKKNNVLLTAAKVISHIEHTVSEKELTNIELLLTGILHGKSGEILSSKEEEQCKRILNIKHYFERNPKDYIVIVGASKISSQIIMGIASSFGVTRKNVRLYTDYPRLKNAFPLEEIGSRNCIGVIVGHVPHNAKGGNGSNIIESIQRIKNGSTVIVPGLKMSKEALRSSFAECSKKITSHS